MSDKRMFYRAIAMRQLAGYRCATRWIEGGRIVSEPAEVAAERARLRLAPTLEEADLLERLQADGDGEYRLCGEPIQLRGGGVRAASQSVVSARRQATTEEDGLGRELRIRRERLADLRVQTLADQAPRTGPAQWFLRDEEPPEGWTYQNVQVELRDTVATDRRPVCVRLGRGVWRFITDHADAYQGDGGSSAWARSTRSRARRFSARSSSPRQARSAATGRRRASARGWRISTRTSASAATAISDRSGAGTPSHHRSRRARPTSPPGGTCTTTPRRGTARPANSTSSWHQAVNAAGAAQTSPPTRCD